MPSCWPKPACAGWTWTTTSRKALGRLVSCPLWGRGLWGSSAAWMTLKPWALLTPLDDPHDAPCGSLLETRLLAELEGGCMIPLAAWASRRRADGLLSLDAALFDPDGRARPVRRLDRLERCSRTTRPPCRGAASPAGCGPDLGAQPALNSFAPFL